MLLGRHFKLCKSMLPNLDESNTDFKSTFTEIRHFQDTQGVKQKTTDTVNASAAKQIEWWVWQLVLKTFFMGNIQG